MGFTSWLQSFRGKNRGSILATSSPHQRTSQAPGPHQRSDAADRKTVASSPIKKQGYVELDEIKQGRRSRAFSLSNNKKNRRSWFGGRPDAEDYVPAVPTLINNGPSTNANVRDAGIAELPASSARRSSVHASLSRANSRNGDDAGRRQLPLRRKSSWFSTHAEAPTAGGVPPPFPATPVAVDRSSRPTTATLPADKRASRRQSLNRQQSQASTKSRRRSRSSYWASSNPDESESDVVPPVPALVRDGSGENTRSDSEDTVGGGNTHERKAVRRMSTMSTSSRKSYTPRTATKAFLRSTSTATEADRRSFRQSFKMDADANIVCLTKEQEIEWSKLMNKERSHKRKDSDPYDSEADAKFSNAQALASLEFGTR